MHTSTNMHKQCQINLSILNSSSLGNTNIVGVLEIGFFRKSGDLVSGSIASLSIGTILMTLMSITGLTIQKICILHSCFA